MNNDNERKNKYTEISSALLCLSNIELKKLISDNKAMHKGIGGTSLLIEVNDKPVFVKKIPLTDLELLPENYMSTANIFTLPLFYQYGIGSAGFGAWRELAAHAITTNWSLTGQCSNFPLMYHYRIVNENIKKEISEEERLSIEKDVAYWENNSHICNRLEANILAKNHIYLFMEHIPFNLYDWLKDNISMDENVLLNRIEMILMKTHETNSFMKSKGFFHMDAHFRNVLTDGENIYYSDFGLATYRGFSLSGEEKKFLDSNLTYDTASGLSNLLHSIVTALHKSRLLQKTSIVEGIRAESELFDRDLRMYQNLLKDYMKDNVTSNMLHIDKFIKRLCPIGLVMNTFYKNIKKDKSTQYPNKEVDALLEDYLDSIR